MIDQKIVQVDSRGILRDVMMRMASESYTRELGSVGKFIDNHNREIFRVINTYYLMELSHNKNANMGDVQNQIQHLVSNCLCRYFPQMTLDDLRSACQLFLEVLTSGYRTRVPPNLGAWDTCEVRELSSDTYVIICSRQTTEPMQSAVGSGLFIQPINVGRNVHA